MWRPFDTERAPTRKYLACHDDDDDDNDEDDDDDDDDDDDGNDGRNDEATFDSGGESFHKYLAIYGFDANDDDDEDDDDDDDDDGNDEATFDSRERASINTLLGPCLFLCRFIDMI